MHLPVPGADQAGTGRLIRSLGGGPWAKFSAQTLSSWALSRSGKVAILRLKSVFNLRLRGLSSSRREAGTHSDALVGQGVKWIRYLWRQQDCRRNLSVSEATTSDFWRRGQRNLRVGGAVSQGYGLAPRLLGAAPRLWLAPVTCTRSRPPFTSKI
jgi:hypothetical protein